ncbi:MAG: DUF2794 domain-containing protein [Magnetospirillum sp.]|nr:DUF2794 domain-containing protein [Magnetospirillum sp.]
MVKVIPLAELRAKRAFVHFNRTELTLLLDLYARRVAAGEWRDYAVDHGPDRAVFSVFHHSGEYPLFTITKLASGKGSRGGVFVVASAGGEITRSGSLSEALGALTATAAEERRPFA